MKEKFNGTKMNENGAIVVIDTVSVSPNITVYRNRRVSGLLEIESLPTTEVSDKVNSLDSTLYPRNSLACFPFEIFALVF